jgi:hypothetical protein
VGASCILYYVRIKWNSARCIEPNKRAYTAATKPNNIDINEIITMLGVIDDAGDTSTKPVDEDEVEFNPE